VDKEIFPRKEKPVDKEMEKVKTALEDFGKKVVEAVKKGKDEADKVTKVAQVKIEIGSLNRQMKDLYQELGELFYKNIGKPSKKGEAEVAEIIGHLSEVEKKVASLNRSLKALRQDKPAPGRRGRPPKSAAEGTGAAPKKRGRPRKAASAKAKSAAPKRRGRPPKSASKA